MNQVWRDLELDDVIAEVIAKRYADRGVVRQHEDTLMLFRHAELLLGADHPLGLHPTNLAGLERLVLQRVDIGIDQSRANERERDLLARQNIRRAGDDSELMRAGVDGCQNEAIRVGVRHNGDDFADEDVLPLLANAGDALGLQAGHRQSVGNLSRWEFGVDHITEPANGYAHISLLQASTDNPAAAVNGSQEQRQSRARPNCDRKRRSLP